MLSIVQYLRFALVGGLSAAVSLCTREIFRLLLGDTSTQRYALSVIVAYAVGMVAGFVMNSRFTFTTRGARSWRNLSKFVVVSCIGMLSTTLISLVLRPILEESLGLHEFGGTLAFLIACLATSLLTYPLNALHVFRGGAASRSPAA